jgi:hypothetical protein
MYDPQDTKAESERIPADEESEEGLQRSRWESTKAGCRMPVAFGLSLVLIQVALCAVHVGLQLPGSLGLSYFPLALGVAFLVTAQVPRAGSRWGIPLLAGTALFALTILPVTYWAAPNQSVAKELVDEAFERNGFPLMRAFNEAVGDAWKSSKGVPGVITFCIMFVAFGLPLAMLAMSVDLMISPFIYLWGFLSPGVIVEYFQILGKGVLAVIPVVLLVRWLAVRCAENPAQEA